MSSSEAVSGRGSPASSRFAVARVCLPLTIGTFSPFSVGFGYNLGIFESFLLLFYQICWLGGTSHAGV